MAAHQAPPSLGFSRQEHWSGLPFPSPMHESEVTQSCQTCSDPMDCSTPGLPVHHQLLEFTQTHVHRWRRQWQPTLVLLPRKSHGWRSLVDCSPWSHYESDVTERLHFDFSLSRNGEGNGNPLQGSCLENPRDGGAWWAAVCGVAQSRSSKSLYYCCSNNGGSYLSTALS